MWVGFDCGQNLAQTPAKKAKQHSQKRLGLGVYGVCKGLRLRTNGRAKLALQVCFGWAASEIKENCKHYVARGAKGDTSKTMMCPTAFYHSGC